MEAAESCSRVSIEGSQGGRSSSSQAVLAEPPSQTGALQHSGEYVRQWSTI